jgi:NAD(P)H-dependent flavin oxidoreductase YrpB (nitropropane dioxygenase family)
MQDIFPRIIQGGMGVAVSSWQLARAVSLMGQLGVVSGTAIDLVLARRLQDGDPEMCRALAEFPDQTIAQHIIDRYYIEGGKPANKPYVSVPMYTMQPRRDLVELAICGGFVEVWLAKDGHSGVVGINLLEKIQLPHLSILYGAMLAGVDYVIMGAGIPTQIPGALDALAQHEQASYRVDVIGAGDTTYYTTLDPRQILTLSLPPLKRPNFLAIISSVTLAKMLVAKSSGKVNGFVVEGATAGGHNAPPRGKVKLNERGEPIYGDRDTVDLAQLAEIGLPFWLAGSFATPEKVQKALESGAAGIQAGSIFALCNESGLRAEMKQSAIRLALAGELDIFTDPVASPTGYPFKVAQLPMTLAMQDHYEQRPRCCDIGRLREPYVTPEGAIGYRCSAEPLKNFVMKGGTEAETVGRKCLCNGLMANIGLGQIHKKDGYHEEDLVTMGDDCSFVHELLKDGKTSYSAADAIAYLCQSIGANMPFASVLVAE